MAKSRARTISNERFAPNSFRPCRHTQAEKPSRDAKPPPTERNRRRVRPACKERCAMDTPCAKEGWGSCQHLSKGAAANGSSFKPARSEKTAAAKGDDCCPPTPRGRRSDERPSNRRRPIALRRLSRQKAPRVDKTNDGHSGDGDGDRREPPRTTNGRR